MRKVLCAVSSALVVAALCACFAPTAGGGSQGEKVFLQALPALFAPRPADAPEGVCLNVWLGEEKGAMVMALEEYVAGVVLAEMPVSYAPEALKAQAVAARTYAISKCARFGGGGCARRPEADVCASSSCCQGYADETRAWEKYGEAAASARETARAAALETAGLVCAFRGRPIQALYHACAGGHTENAENVYAEALAYLRGVPSKGEESYKQYAAETRYTLAALQKAFEGDDDVQFLSTLPLYEQLAVLERSDTGRVLKMRAGLSIVAGNDFRRALGLKSAIFEMSFQNGCVVFKTYGYGHGVGMSQTGADAMARGGADYTEILSWYYTGITLEPLDALVAARV